jgi:bifunctional UDP-N-acetylglucosamine pyrophosphorylase/glucosamine-1-phosphate N-acetyltransferase
VNSRRELAKAHSVLQKRYLGKLMDSGVTLIQPESVSIGKDVVIGRDSVIYPNTFLTGVCNIGSGVVVDSFVSIHNCMIGDGARIGSFTLLQQSKIPSGIIIAPYTRDINSH